MKKSGSETIKRAHFSQSLASGLLFIGGFMSAISKKLKKYRKINLKRAIHNSNENWMFQKLKRTGLWWERQRIFNYRIFDFYCREIRVAIEVDGPEHDMVYEAWRDALCFNKFGIEVIRVRNKNEEDAKNALQAISIAERYGNSSPYLIGPIKEKIIGGWRIIKKSRQKNVQTQA